MPKIEALILAAGLSSRMGQNKMLMNLSNKPIIETTLENVLNSNITHSTVVLGNEQELLRSVLKKYKISLVENHNFLKGMSSSIQTGIKHIMTDPSTDAALLFLGDMPFIKPETINRIIDTYSKLGSLIVIPLYKGKKGHPVLFDKKLFGQLLKINPDVGAREVVYNNEVTFIEVDDPGILKDIDTKSDYLAAINQN